MPIMRIPAPLRAVTDGHGQVHVEATTVRGALAALESAHPGIADRLRDPHGELHRFLNVFVGDDDVRDLQGLQTPVGPDDTVTLVPAVAGGACDGDRMGTVRRTLVAGVPERPCTASVSLSEWTVFWALK